VLWFIQARKESVVGGWGGGRRRVRGYSLRWPIEGGSGKFYDCEKRQENFRLSDLFISF